MLSTINRSMLTTVAKGLDYLLKDMVFVGGAIPELYVSAGREIVEVRQTEDIDCIVEITGRTQYAILEEQLRALKFVNDQKVICRWHYKNIIVDVMPTDKRILGFSNPWYKQGFSHTLSYPLEQNLSIQILPLPFFIACKLEALFNRGIKDLRLSKDWEDLVFLINHVDKIEEKINSSVHNVRSFIKNKFSELLVRPQVYESIFCVLPLNENESDNIVFVFEKMKKVAENETETMKPFSGSSTD